MSADEFAEWFAFDRISPIGAIRGDLHAAIVAQTVANCHIGRWQRPFKRTDFMPFYEAPKATDEEIGDIFLAWGKQIQASIDHRKKKCASPATKN